MITIKLTITLNFANKERSSIHTPAMLLFRHNTMVLGAVRRAAGNWREIKIDVVQTCIGRRTKTSRSMTILGWSQRRRGLGGQQ